jgi:hypothetical protein
MTNLLEDAVQVLRKLPESLQRNAHAILEYAASYEDERLHACLTWRGAEWIIHHGITEHARTTKSTGRAGCRV